VKSIRVDLVGATASCGPDCASFLETWTDWWASKSCRPLALLDCSPGYRGRLQAKSRNMLSKADRLYTYRLIDRNDHLDEIYAINTSTPVRQGRPMTDAYQEPPRPSTSASLCTVHRDEWHGCFDHDGHLRAYARLEVLNEIGILNTIIGDRAAGGAMNGLIAHLAETAGVRWINYLRMPSATTTLTDFKRRVGFEEVSAR
jgi:hypothetical protein